MGRRTQRLKIFGLEVVCVALLSAAGYLGYQNYESQRKLRDLRQTVSQLEAERRELKERSAVAARALKPEQREEVRREIEQQTSQLRELEFKQPVNYKVLERAALKDALVGLIHEQYSDEEIRRYARALETFGVIPKGTDLLQLWVGLYGEQIGAFYVPEARALYTFVDLSLSGGLDRMMLAHELTHALQDQNFDLTKLPLKVKDNDDLALATSALLEGDATVLMTQFYAEKFERSNLLGDLGAMLTQQTKNLQDAPTFVRELLLFPYQHGQKFATSLHMRGGMAQLNRALADPPTSTEQILHPERYLGNRDVPTPVTLPEPERKSWEMIWENVMGEFGIQQLLQSNLRAVESQMAAEGWDGDRYRVYESKPDGPAGFIWRSTWDTEQDAVEFEAAYRNRSKQRGIKQVILRDGIYVTIFQSEDSAFYAMWKDVPAPK